MPGKVPRQSIVEQGEYVRSTGGQRQHFSFALAQISSQRQDVQMRSGPNPQPIQLIEIGQRHPLRVTDSKLGGDTFWNGDRVVESRE